MGFSKQITTSARIIASDNNWIEDEAVLQLTKTAALKGMVQAIGLPDLHPGKTYPVGAAFISQDIIYPALVGNDIGCGMGLWKTELLSHKFKIDKGVKALGSQDGPWKGNADQWLQDRNTAPSFSNYNLGTIGGGNHFAELQKIEKIHDQVEFDQLNLDHRALYLLVHSGSRGLGDAILQTHLSTHNHAGLEINTAAFTAYLAEHNHAISWAEANRALIAHRFLTAWRTTGQQILDINHNTVTPCQYEGKAAWIHRKGATPSDVGPVVIPGSRGSLSYLVMPTGNQDECGSSLAHGAGRKWARGDARSKLAKYRKEDFSKTSFGSRVICEDKDLIFEEAPQAYKDIDIVVDDLVQAGLIKIIATLQPVITYKTRHKK